MSVAKCLGLDDIDGPAMLAAGVAWQRWCHQDPELAVVDELLDLPDWTRRATTATKDDLLVRLHRLAQHDAEAAAVLAWLLLPGATRLADRLRDISPDIDALAAGELWLEIRRCPAERCVAATVLRAVRRSLLAELGHGETAQRRDRVWASTTLCDNADQLPRVEDPSVCAASESGFLVQAAVLNGAITSADADLLLALAQAASEVGAASRRGRAGLTSPAVVDAVTGPWPIGGRTIRRRVSGIVGRLRRFALEHHIDEDLHDFIATHDLPPVEVDEFLELYLWDHIEEYLDEIHDDCDASA